MNASDQAAAPATHTPRFDAETRKILARIANEPENQAPGRTERNGRPKKAKIAS